MTDLAHLTSTPFPDLSTLDVHRRASILDYATRLAGGDVPCEHVTALAAPLLAWLEQATDRVDKTARANALQRADINGTLRQRANRSAPETPEEFLKQAEGYYAFLAAS